MSLLIQVDSVEKGCPVIVNLDHVMEIAPLAAGGCMVRFISDGSGNIREFRVKNEYTEFKQFVLETVSADTVSKKVKELKKLQEQTGEKERIPLKAGSGDEIPSFGK